MRLNKASVLTILLLVAGFPAAAQQGVASGPQIASYSASIPAQGLVRLKDIANVQGVRGNQLIGYGLVVGLEGTGDGQSTLFTVDTLANMLRRFGINVAASSITVKNVAAVMVTATLPPYAKPGSRIDVIASSMGDAKSLQGGTLLQTPMRAADGQIYAVAQGPLSIGGFNYSSGGSSVQKNDVNVGRVPNGAYVEQAVPMPVTTDGTTLQVSLAQPDFTTAARVASAIRNQLVGVNALAMDADTITVDIPSTMQGDMVRFISRVERVTVTPDVQAKIVVDERTGTVVIGGNVRLAPGAVAHGDINIQVTNTPVVVPAPPGINAPAPVVVPQKATTATESGGKLAIIPATTTVDQLVHALNALGVSPRDLISILQGMRAAGLIDAEIEIM
jgi:flagellar P-ring protein precursor FlgI